ncbi:hypothetical protein V8E53_011629, partial [Lactarius tabidus]
MPTRAQETNLCRSSAVPYLVCQPAPDTICLLHLSPRAAARAYGIPHHPQFHLWLPSAPTLPPNTVLHLLQRRRADDADQARPIHTIPLLKFYRGFSISLVGIVPYTGTGFIKWDYLRAATPVPYRRTRGHFGAYILVSVRGPCAVVAVGRDRAQYLGAWWATEVSCRLCRLAGLENAIRCAGPSKSRTPARRRASQKRRGRLNDH